MQAESRYEIVTEPVIEPVTLDQLKRQCNVTITDYDQDLIDWGMAARKLIEGATGRAFITTTFKMYLDALPMGGGYWNRDIRRQGPDPNDPRWLPTYNAPIVIQRCPLQSIVSLQFTAMDGTLQTYDPTLLRISLGTPGRVAPEYNQFWPWTRPVNDAVQLTFVAGVDTADLVPPEAKALIRLLVAGWYSHRELIQ